MSSDGLELRKVTAGFGGAPVVRSVDLRVARGEIVALLGPSGCGKSTLLRSIAGLHPISEGAVLWNGVDLAAVATHRRSIGLVFQHHALFPHRTVAENIAFGLRMQGVSAAGRAARVDDLLTLVDLAGYGSRTIDTLSGGEAQRVALARALAPEPHVLLLDEPLAALDRSLRDRLVTDVRRIVTTLGITAVHVTHDQDEAATIADRVALMAAGEIIRTGDLDAIARDPKTAGVARFLGLETLYRATVREGRAQTPFGEVAAAGRPDGEIVVLVRAEHVAVSTDPVGERATIVAGRRTERGWLVMCDTADGRRVAARTRDRPSEGTAVWVSVNLDRAEILEG